MSKKLTCVALMVSALTAWSAGQSPAEPVLAASVEFATFSEIQRKVTNLGMMINNPVIPMMLLSTGQQQLIQTCGKFRTDAPAGLFCYIQTPAFEAAVADGDGSSAEKLVDCVLVYPSVEKPATMLLTHPGARKDADGTIHLPDGEGATQERCAVFSADGLFCAYTKAVPLARQALADFEKIRAARKTRKDSPIARVEVTPSGLTALAAVQRWVFSGTPTEQQLAALGPLKGILSVQRVQRARQLKELQSFEKAELSVDLNDLGLSVDCAVRTKPGTKGSPAGGFRLPAGVLDAVPTGAPVFAAMNPLGDFENESEFRETLNAVVNLSAAGLCDAKKDGKPGKYAPVMEGFTATLRMVAEKCPFPAVSDWTVSALAFGPNREPYVVSTEERASAAVARKVTQDAVDCFAKALDKQWPGQKILVRTPDGFVCDWGALLEVAAQESGAADARKEIAQAKRVFASIFGGLKSEVSTRGEGTHVVSSFAPVGFKMPAIVQKTGEARVAAALPETEKDRPSGVVCVNLYGLVRDIVFPVVAEVVSKKDAAQYRTMIQAMPPAGANSAFASAVWVGKDGSKRILLRLTANEIRNYGMAFNAFTAASMSSALDDDKDE